MKNTICAVFCVLLLAGCSALGSYSMPGEQEMAMSAGNLNVSSRKEAFNEFKKTIKRVKPSGKYIFDECGISAISDTEMSVNCTMYEQDRAQKSFSLKAAGSHSYTLPLCPPTFRATRQVPLMSYYFFVNGLCFDGNKEKAVKAYNLLKYYCEH